MSRPTMRIHNVETNEIIDREMTVEEYKKFQQEEKIYLEYKAKEIAETQANTSARQALLDRLGITADEAKMLHG
jgi:hypothetical protein